MNSGRNKKVAQRVAKLEGHVLPAPPSELLRAWPGWPLIDQLEAVTASLSLHQNGRSRYLATDREITLSGLASALAHVGLQGGRHVFESGLAVVVSRDESASPDGYGFRLETPRPIRVSDLPTGVKEFFRRMPPERQPERERFLYENRHRAKAKWERLREWDRRWETSG